MSTSPPPSWWAQNDSGWCMRANRAGGRIGVRQVRSLDGFSWEPSSAVAALAASVRA